MQNTTDASYKIAAVALLTGMLAPRHTEAMSRWCIWALAGGLCRWMGTIDIGSFVLRAEVAH